MRRIARRWLRDWSVANIKVHSPGLAEDRYGRLAALVADGSGEFAQIALLRAGLARVAAPFGDLACARALIAAENQARAAGLGLWADPHYVSKNADNPADVIAVRGRVAVVEGRIQSVRESGGQYLRQLRRSVVRVTSP